MREKFAIYISERSLIFKTCKEMKILTLKKLNLQLTSELMRWSQQMAPQSEKNTNDG